MKRYSHQKHFLHRHSLSLTVLCFLLLWIFLFQKTEDTSRFKDLYDNAIADWAGALIIMVVTKYLHEKGSTESRPFKEVAKTPFSRFLVEHSLSLFLGALLMINIGVWNHLDPKSPAGEVAGNTLSQLLQLLALVLLTKKLFEQGAKKQ